MRLSVLLTIAAIAAAGCDQGGLAAYRGYHLGPAETTVAAAVEFMGGLENWRRVGRVRADAVMTLYDRKGQAYVNSQEHDIDINGGRLTVRAVNAADAWTATCTRGGATRFWGAKPLDRAGAAQLGRAIELLADRIAGPLNLLGGGERPGKVTHVVIDGKNLVRVAVVGRRPRRATAYYFDADSGRLDMVSAGSERPGGDGTVTLYTYQMLPDGMVFPRKIRQVHTGRNVLVGHAAIMEVDYSNVRIN